MLRADIERLLPTVFERASTPGSALSALLDVMAALHEPAEHAIAHLGDTFHPYRCPDRFVPYLAGWVDLDRLLVDVGEGTPGLPTGVGPLRNIVAAAAELAAWRGTANGLVDLLELATGDSGFRVEHDVTGSDGTVRPFVVHVHVPSSSSAHRRLIEHIVREEKPAHVVCEVIVPLPPPHKESR
jgi:phage tail-like protein